MSCSLRPPFRHSRGVPKQPFTALAVGTKCLLKRKTMNRLESLAGFRNVLVHDYAEIDLRRVHASLDRLEDFDAFVSDVEEWLEQQISS